MVCWPGKPAATAPGSRPLLLTPSSLRPAARRVVGYGEGERHRLADSRIGREPDVGPIGRRDDLCVADGRARRSPPFCRLARFCTRASGVFPSGAGLYRGHGRHRDTLRHLPGCCHARQNDGSATRQPHRGFAWPSRQILALAKWGKECPVHHRRFGCPNDPGLCFETICPVSNTGGEASGKLLTFVSLT